MRQTIDELMFEVNCLRFPERWREIYDEAMDTFDKEGCALCDPAYYDDLGDRYGILKEHRAVYRVAAEAIRSSEPLSRFLALLVRALRDRDVVFDDLKQLKAPVSPDGEHNIAYDMLTGLAICSLVPYCDALLRKRNLPEEIIKNTLALPEHGIEEYRKRNGGADGYHLLEWFQRSIEGRLFRLSRLEIELAYFRRPVTVFRHCTSGNTVALASGMTLHRSGFALGAKHYEDDDGAFIAELEETESSYCGHPFLESGFVSKDTVTLQKSEWEKALICGDPIISLHIPPIGPLTPEAVDATLRETKAFLRDYFPEFSYKAFVCGSWLLDPQLETLLGRDANIVKFGKRFARLTAKSAGNGVFNFVFKKPNNDFDIRDLPETTRLERALKAHYLGGKAIYEMYGYFF